jgi:hypothetical protein
MYDKLDGKAVGIAVTITGRRARHCLFRENDKDGVADEAANVRERHISGQSLPIFLVDRVCGLPRGFW